MAGSERRSIIAYVAKPGANPDPKNHPRLLTIEEANHVLEEYPDAFSPDIEVRKQFRNDIREWLRPHMDAWALDPSMLGIAIRRMIEYHYLAVMPPMTRIGFVSTESIIAETQQANFNTFKAAGSSSTVGNSIDMLRELMYNFQRKIPISRISFRNKLLSFEEVFELQSQFVGVTPARFLISPGYELGTWEEMFGPGSGQEWWLKIFETLNGKRKFESVWVLKLLLDREQMFIFDTTPEEIAETIYQQSRLIKIYYPPVSSVKGKEYAMYIVCDRQSIQKELEEHDLFTHRSFRISDQATLAEMIYLTNFLFPRLARNYVKGFPEITEFYPITNPVLKYLKSERYLTKERAWELVLDPIAVDTIGISSLNLSHLLVNAGFSDDELELDPHSIDAIRVRYSETGEPYKHLKAREEQRLAALPKDMPPEIAQNPTLRAQWEQERKPRGVKDWKPSSYVNELLDEHIEKRTETELKNVREFKSIAKATVERSDLEKASEYIQAETRGSVTSLGNLFKHPAVDPRFTFTNNPRELRAFLGIEGARTGMLKEITEIVGESGTDRRYFDFMIECQTRRGVIQGVNASGTDRQSGGVLSNIALNNIQSHLVYSASIGASETTQTIMGAMIPGAPITGGTGSVITGFRKEDLRKREFERKEEFTPEDFGWDEHEFRDLETLGRGGENEFNITQTPNIVPENSTVSGIGLTLPEEESDDEFEGNRQSSNRLEEPEWITVFKKTIQEQPPENLPEQPEDANSPQRTQSYKAVTMTDLSFLEKLGISGNLVMGSFY